MVEDNTPEVLFQQSGTNKDDYVNILIGTYEFLEGNVIWAYQLGVAREPNTQEINNLMAGFQQDMDMKKLQQKIMILDEYAGFN